MSVTTNDRRKQYPGDGVTTVFNGPMAYSATTISATLVDNITGAETSAGAFTVTQLGKTVGTRVTMVVPPPVGKTLVLLRTVTYAQGTDITNQGAFNASVLEGGLDQIVFQTQQLADQVGRSPQLPPAGIDGLSRYDANGNKLGGLADGTESSDAATVGQIAGMISIPTGPFVQVGTGAVPRTVLDKLREIEFSIYDFGYVDGQDATLPIQRAIDALPARGGRVRLPPGNVNVTGQINIGNGDGGLNPSTKQGVKLVGTGSGLLTGSANPTLLDYVGANRTDHLIKVNGRIGDCVIEDILISCNGNTSGVEMEAFGGCRMRNVKINNPSVNGLTILGGAAPTGNYNIFNEFDNVQITLFGANTIGLYMDGVYGVGAMNDTWLTTFTRVRIEVVAGALNAKCAWFRFVDSCTFMRCHFDNGPEPTAVGALFDALGSDLYPGGVSFYDCSIKSTQVLEDGTHKIGKMYFYGFGTYDGETIPTHPNLTGITDSGVIFGDFLYNSAWTTFTPTVTLVGGAGNTVPVYTNNRARYKKIGKTVHFLIHLDGDGGTDGAGTGVINIALPQPVKNDASYYAEIHGRVVDTASSYLAIGRMLPGATTMPIRTLSGTTLADLTGAQQANVRTIAITGTYECE